MDLIDRSTLPSIHAAARHHRSVYLSCLLARVASGIASLLSERPAQRAVPCA